MRHFQEENGLRARNGALLARPARRARRDPPAVILGGRGTAVPVARRLAAAGIDVYALGRACDPVAWSRFRSAFVGLGDGDGAQERWLEWLREGPRGAVLVPCADEGLELVASRHRELRELGYRLPEGDPKVMLAMLDKRETYALAERAGIATPRTAAVGCPDDAAEAARAIGFPSALKPVQSHKYATHFHGKAVIVRDLAELRATLAETYAAGVPMLLTEIVPGGDDQLAAYVSYADDAGVPLVDFTSHKIRQYPNGFGIGSYVVNHRDEELAERGLQFVRAMGVRGPSYVEFKRDDRDGDWKLIECNHRLTIEFASFEPDLPVVAYERSLGLPSAVAPRRYARTYQWNPLDDLRALRSYRRRRALSPLGWLRSFRLPLHLHVYRWDDPLPTIGYHAFRVTQRWRAGARPGRRRITG